MSSDRKVGLWSAATGEARMLVGHGLETNDAAFSHDGRTLATCSDDRTVRLWDAATGAPGLILAGHTQSVRHVAFSADDAFVYSSGTDDTVRVWSVAGGGLRRARGRDRRRRLPARARRPRARHRRHRRPAVHAAAARAHVPATFVEMRAWLDAQTTARVGADGVLASP